MTIERFWITVSIFDIQFIESMLVMTPGVQPGNSAIFLIRQHVYLLMIGLFNVTFMSILYNPIRDF